MPKILIIDDFHSEINKLKDYLQSGGIAVDDIIPCILPNEKSRGIKYSVSEQAANLKSVLKKYWDSSDILLVDLALLALPLEEPPLSQAAVLEFIGEHATRKKALEAREKYVVFTTSYGIKTGIIKLPLEFRELILIEKKPDYDVQDRFREKALCKNPSYCNRFSSDGEQCDQNDCLVQLIMSLKIGMEEREDGA